MVERLSTLLLGLALLALAPGFAQAQTGVIEGVVVGPGGASIPGANVVLDGTTYGTATNVDGEFQFTAPTGEYTLAVSFVGYERYEAPVTIFEGETLELNVQLTEGGINLDEIVVTALGIQREEKTLGYSFQEVEEDVIERSNESNLVTALSGKVAGVQVTSSSGQPGKAARIVIRGNSSITGNNQPIFVIDGMPISNAEDENVAGSSLFTGGAINRAVDIDPSIIEDVTVLKGAAAMALYGSRAANGAIIITTKGGRGVQDQGVQVTFSTRARWDDAVIDGYQTEYAQGRFGCYFNGLPGEDGFVDAACLEAAGETVTDNAQTTRSWGPRIDDINNDPELLQRIGVDRVQQYDPRDDFYQMGAVIENSLSIAGSALGGNYFLSGSWLDQEGIVPNTEMDRVSVMAKVDADLTERFSMRTSVNYIRTENTWMTEGNGAGAFVFTLNYMPLTFDVTNYQQEDGSQINYSGAYNNPLWLVNNNAYTSDVDRFIGSARLGYKILPWLQLAEQVGLDTYTDTRKGMVNVGTRGEPDGSMYDQTLNRRDINSDLILTATPEIGGPFGFDVLVGNNILYQYYRTEEIYGQNLGIPGFFSVNNAADVQGDEYHSSKAILGLYSQATFDYDDWAYLTLTARNDWSSTLPEDNRSYFYPSASLSLIFTEASEMFSNTPLSFGKVRASWARIGNDAPLYSTSTGFIQANPGDGVRGNIAFPFNGANAYQLNNVLGNPELKPELSSEYEVGLDLRFFGQRARLDAAYYNRTTTDQIFQVPISATTGFVQRLMNAGEIKNSGVELFLGLHPIQTENFAWDISANWSNNTTEVVEMTEGVESIFLAGFENPQIRIQQGEGGYGVIWGDQFLRYDPNDEDQQRYLAAEGIEVPETVEEGTVLIGTLYEGTAAEINGVPLIAPTLGAIGNVQPDWMANVRSSLTFKGLTASALVDIRRGGDVLNMDLFYATYYGTSEVTADRGTTTVYDGFNVNTGEMNGVEVLRDRNYYQNFYATYGENWVEDGSFIKLRELSLSYALPQSLARRGGFRSASITATGRNLWIGSDFSYGDPEGSLTGAGNAQGFYHAVTPGTKSYSLGLRVTL